MFHYENDDIMASILKYIIQIPMETYIINMEYIDIILY